MSLAALPSELYSVILEHVADEDIQSSILSLTRAIPDAPIPLERLFERIRIQAPERSIQLHRRLRGDGRAEARYVRELSIETWTVDPQVVVNLLALLDNLTSLSLFIGASFGPESLVEVFERPRERLEMLSLRFRPYVQRANYHHFLKGAYFDPVISAIAGWPSSSLRALSIVQDPLREPGPFAQPLVFFTLQPFLALSISPTAQAIKSLRVRVPSRDLVSFLAAGPRAFPSLRILDLSTANVNESQLLRIFSRFDTVQHLRLDACALLGVGARDPLEWTALGKECALAGVKRAREREKTWKTWKETLAADHQPLGYQSADPGIGGARSRGRAGRKGLAMSTLSLRGSSGPTAPPSLSQSPPPEPIDPRMLERKIRIIPLPPSLLTLTTTIPFSIAGLSQTEHFATVCKGFQVGWDIGINQLRATWSRLRTSSQRDVLVMALNPGADPEARGLGGLEEVDEERWKTLQDGSYPAPTLCLAGESEDGVTGELHPEGCGHRVTERVWGDPMFNLVLEKETRPSNI